MARNIHNKRRVRYKKYITGKRGRKGHRQNVSGRTGRNL